ncbi:hypothetical protein Peur_022704 [Populus x canadensis]
MCVLNAEVQVSSLVRRINAPLCRGNKVTQEKMVLEVHVEKGMQHGQKIVFEGQADEAPDSITRGCCCCIAIERAPQF